MGMVTICRSQATAGAQNLFPSVMLDREKKDKVGIQRDGRTRQTNLCAL